MDPDPGLKLFSNLGDVSRTARQILAQAMARGGTRLLPSVHLDLTLEHLGHVREGFIITLRTTSFRSRSELRHVVRAILVDWKWLEPLGLRWMTTSGPLEKPTLQVVAFAHAAVTLGAMRHLPADQVTFPQLKRSYADIPVPGSPGEILQRIEEMEVVMARSSRLPLSRCGREPVRRTYGYFETGAWLVGQHWRLGSLG